MLLLQVRDLLLECLCANHRPVSSAGLGDEDAGDMRQQFVPWADALLAKLTPQGAGTALQAAAKGRGGQAAVAVVAADGGGGAQFTQNGNGHAGDSGSAAGDDGAVSDEEEEGEEGDNFVYDEEDDEGAGSEVGRTRISMGAAQGALLFAQHVCGLQGCLMWCSTGAVCSAVWSLQQRVGLLELVPHVVPCRLTSRT